MEHRLMREMKSLRRDSEVLMDLGISLDDDAGENLTNFNAVIRGPPETPYEGGTFHVSVRIPPRYPDVPPVVTFLTRVWHPNIDKALGTVCVDTLKTAWRQGMTIRVALITIQALLASPAPESPQDLDAGRQMIENEELFKKTAKFWTYKFANGPKCVPEFFRLVNDMNETGIGEDEDQRILMLSKTDWKYEEAAGFLLDGDEPDIDLNIPNFPFFNI